MSAIRQLFGLFGSPVNHSLSPEVHGAAFKLLGRQAAYLPFEIAEDQLADGFAAARLLKLAGFNLTQPHKEKALELCDEVAPEAAQIGAVNVVLREGERLLGHNTDAGAVSRAVASQRADLRGQRALVLGAGGAAKAAAFALAKAGCSEVLVANRTFSRAQELASSLSEQGFEILAAPLSAASLRELLPISAVVVNATSVGQNAADESPVPEGAIFDPDAVAVDLVYRPLKTRFLAQAREQGVKTVDGLEILVEQGLGSLALWLDKAVDTTRLAPVMRAAALEGLL